MTSITPSLPAYFISDIHLGFTEPRVVPDRETKLVQLLRSWKGVASHVVIGGDAFEFWMEYRDFVPRGYMPFLRALAELVESGVEVHYLAGNHDFELGSFFHRELGVRTHRVLHLDLQGRRIYCLHGDGMARSDTGYRIARKVITHPWSIAAFRLLHPDWGMALARFVGGNSRHYGETRDPRLSQYSDAARDILRSEGCDMVIHGHNHHGGVVEYPEGWHVNTGQWLYQLTYVELRDGVPKLVVVDPGSNLPERYRKQVP